MSDIDNSAELEAAIEDVLAALTKLKKYSEYNNGELKDNEQELLVCVINERIDSAIKTMQNLLKQCKTC